MGYGNGSIMFEKIDKALEHINPFEEMDSNTGPVLPEHVDQFIKDKKANEEHKKKEDEMVKNWKDEIEINKGVNNE
jgi:hypothetical protein